MSLRRFESYIRKLSRVLYDDDLTPILIDFIIKHQLYDICHHLSCYKVLNLNGCLCSFNWKMAQRKETER